MYDRLDFDSFLNVGAIPTSGAGEGGDYLHRLDVTRLGFKDSQFILGQLGVSIELRQIFGRDGANVDCQLTLQFHVGFQAGPIALVDDDDHAGVGEDRGPAD